MQRLLQNLLEGVNLDEFLLKREELAKAKKVFRCVNCNAFLILLEPGNVKYNRNSKNFEIEPSEIENRVERKDLSIHCKRCEFIIGKSSAYYPRDIIFREKILVEYINE